MIRELLATGEIALAKSRLTGGVPMEDWTGLSPLQKLTVFKLLAPQQAIAFFKTLGFDDRYLLLCGFEPGSIAPVTEYLPPARRALFEKLGPGEYSEMLRSLSA